MSGPLQLLIHNLQLLVYSTPLVELPPRINKVRVQDCFEDPVKIWSTLKSVHLQQKPGMRFDAWEEFFSIHIDENKSLSSLMTRIDAAMLKVKNLCPSSFTFDDEDKETLQPAFIN